MSKTIESVKQDLESRELRGLHKYGTTVDRDDLNELDWLQHAYEEALDLAVYLKRTIELKKQLKTSQHESSGTKEF
jgi:hypothetical protein